MDTRFSVWTHGWTHVFHTKNRVSTSERPGAEKYPPLSQALNSCKFQPIIGWKRPSPGSSFFGRGLHFFKNEEPGSSFFIIWNFCEKRVRCSATSFRVHAVRKTDNATISARFQRAQWGYRKHNVSEGFPDLDSTFQHSLRKSNQNPRKIDIREKIFCDRVSI